MSLDAAIKELKAQLAQDSWTEDQDIIAPHLKEWRDRWQGVTPFLVQPKTTDEVVTIVSICREKQAPLCLQGGNTGLVGGQIPQGEILLTTKRLRAVRNQTPESLTVESGITLSQLHELADSQNKKFPLSLASEGTATIGGLCSTNAGGVHVVKYGSMRHLVTALEVVLADGSIANTLNPLKKDNTGYALTSNFISAEGTLGIITAATLKLFPKPKDTKTLCLAINSPDEATELYFRLKDKFPNELAVIELIPSLAVEWVTDNFDIKKPFAKDYPWFVLIELEIFSQFIENEIEAFMSESLSNKLILNVIVSTSIQQSKQLRALRESISAAQKFIGGSIKHDVSVPVEKVAEFIDKASCEVTRLIPNCRPLPFGHVGDGNIHFNVMQPVDIDKDEYLSHWETMNRVVHGIVCELGGSISAEHGIGILKKDELAERADAVKLSHMKRLKQAFDPDNLFNPRVLFTQS